MKRMGGIYWLAMALTLVTYGYFYWEDAKYRDRAEQLEMHVTWSQPPTASATK